LFRADRGFKPGADAFFDLKSDLKFFQQLRNLSNELGRIEGITG
jgi:hypothetical protein